VGRIGVRVADLDVIDNLSPDDPYSESNKLLDFIINENKTREDFTELENDFKSLKADVNTSIIGLTSVLEIKMKELTKFFTDENTQLTDSIKTFKEQYDLDSIELKKVLKEQSEFEEKSEKSLIKTQFAIIKIQEAIDKYKEFSNDILSLDNNIFNLMKKSNEDIIDLFRQMNENNKKTSSDVISVINTQKQITDSKLDNILKIQQKTTETLDKIAEIKEKELELKRLKYANKRRFLFFRRKDKKIL
jgi:hypothetical protein